MFDFFKKALSEGAPDYEPSTSRVLCVICTIASIVWISLVVYHSHAIPDVSTLGGTAAFSTAPYAINKVTGMAAKD